MLSCSKENNLIINSYCCQKEYMQAIVTALICINISGPLYSRPYEKTPVIFFSSGIKK